MKYFKFKFLMVLLALAAAIPPVGAEESLLVCDGTATSGYLPIAYAGAYGESYPRHQMIYPAELLADLDGATIKGLTFYTQQSIMCNQGTFNVLIGETSQTSYSGSNLVSGLTTVVNHRAPQTGGTEFVVNFDNDYEYQGGNLVIEFYINENLYPYYASLYFYGQNQSTNTGYGYGGARTFLPKVAISYEPGTLEPYKIKVDPTSIDFGKTTPNTSITKNVTVTNKGSNPITPVVTGLTAPFSTTYTPAAIANNETATIPIVYNPTTTGEFDCLFNVGDADDNIDPVEVIVSGTCANEITVADGTTSDGHLPVYGSWFDADYQINQMLYTQDMLTGLVGKDIKSMTFYAPNGLKFYRDGNTATVTFKLANMDANTPLFTSEPYHKDANFTAETTITMPDQAEAAAITEWEITFDNPFTYTGGDLLLEVNTVKGSYGGTYFTGIETAGYQSYYQYNSNAYNYDFLPKITFNIEDSGETPVVTVDAPVFDPEDGTTFEENLSVTLTCATAGATIQYSYNGEYFTDYTEPITIDETTTIYAKAVLGDVESEVVQATYTKEAAPQPSTNEYVLVTDVADLAAGKHIIFVNKENAKAMSSTQNNNNRSATEITIASDVATATEATEIFTLEQEQVEDAYYWLFKASKTPGYIYAAGASSNNYLRTEETADNKAQATIEIASNGEATVAFNAGSRNTMMYNNTSDIFSCYASTSTQQPVYIFIEKSGDTPEPTQVAKPTFDPEEGEYTEAQNVTITCETEDAIIHYTTDGTEPTAESPVYSEAIAVGETMTIKAIAMKEGMTNSEIASATYTINIPVPVEGKTFVKVTAADQLVAGKKYIIVSGNKALGTTPTGNFLTAIDVTAGDEVTVSDDGVAIMTLAGTTGHYTLALGDTYLHAANTTSLDFGNSTEWAISDYNGTLDGYRVKHADYNRAVRYASGYNRFGNYSTTDQNSEYGWIYVEKEEVTPEPEQVATPTFDPEEGTYTEAQNVTIACETEDATIHYTTDGTEPTAESPVYSEAIAVGETMTIKAIAMKEGMTDSEIASATYTINIPVPVVVAAPTFTPEPGSYTEAQTVTIACTTEDAVVYYSTDGGESWTEGNTVTVNEDMTLMAKAVVGDVETVANAVYSFEFPVAPIDMEPFDGYFYVKNLGNEQYANVLGRKTLRFTDAPEDKAGTVIRLKTDEHGQVISLRSQACDLQGYANKAMNYVPEFVHLVADKLELEGVGQLFGETGVDAILDKFNEAFDHHLYVEPAEGGYRIYGKTPSMQHVVDFYRENQAKCDAKLPMLEEAINNAIDKILEKTNGSGASILEHFSLHTIWEKMNNPYLTEPVDDASTMAFYHQVLMNKDFVWDFAYETAMIYWTNLKNHPRYENEIKPQLGEFAEYLDKIENIRPNFKYYIVQKNDKPDFISQGNVDIKNNAPRTIWSVEPRTEFVVNVPEEATYFNKYVTTLYTDFAYDLPEGVTAYKVVGINDAAFAQIKAIDGTIPAQMPVLLISKTAGDLTLTLNNNDGKAHADNQLKGPDYLIGQYQLKSPTVEKVFNLVKSLFGEEIYNNYMLDYEHLMLRYAGNVKNKYFFGLSEEDVAACGTTNEYDQVECVVRSLEPTEGDDAAFYNNGIVSANKAFLVNDTYDPIKIMIKGDIDRNGKANIVDVTALIDILLNMPDEPFTEQYDYEAADFDENGEIKIKDLTDLIDYLLDNGIEGEPGEADDEIYDNE